MFTRKNQTISNFIESIIKEAQRLESVYSPLTNYTPSNYVGETKTESGVNEDGTKWYRTTYSTKDGSYTQSSYLTTTGSDTNNWYTTPSFEKTNTPTQNTTNTPTSETTYKKVDSTIYQLRESLTKAVENQNYEEAVRLRDEITTYEKNREEITSLKLQLEKAVSTHNFEDAIKFRDKIKKFEFVK